MTIMAFSLVLGKQAMAKSVKKLPLEIYIQYILQYIC